MIEKNNLFLILNKGKRKYPIKDMRYRTAANPKTINKFGPSGSFNKRKNNLEKKIDITPKNINDLFFLLNTILLIISV